jgi:hypothetical protein
MDRVQWKQKREQRKGGKGEKEKKNPITVAEHGVVRCIKKYK